MTTVLQSLPAPAGFPAEHSSRGSILVVEDPLVGRFLRVILQKHHYEASPVESFTACERLRNRKIAVELVITNRPESFCEFAATLPLLYIAANPDYLLAAQFANCLVLPKPFRNEELLDAVERLTGSVVT